MKRGNGMGTIAKLPGNRRRPYAVKITTGYSEKGTQQYKYLSYHRTYREALQALNRYIDDPYTLKSVTLAALYDEWIALQDGKADGTLRAYETAYKKLKPLHDVKVGQIDRLTLQHFYDSLPGTVNSAVNVRKLLQNLIKYAVKRGYLPISALNLHKVVEISDKPEPHKIDRKIITDEERSHLWELSRTSETAKIILFYIYTGLRYSELFELQEENCYPDHLEIVKAKTKAGVRVVPLSDKAKSLLPIQRVPEYGVFNRYFKEFLPGHHVHDTRHTFTTLLAQAGVDERTIKAIIGHSAKDVTDHYTHIELSVMLEAVNKI